MKRAKVTRRTKTVGEYILQPSRVRMASIYAVLFVLALAAGLLIRYVTSGFKLEADQFFAQLPLNFLLIVAGSFILAMIDYRRWTLTVKDGTINGPSGAFGERTTLQLSEIDWPRTLKSLSSRVKIGNGIYTLDQRVLISPWFYIPSSYQDFLTALGRDEAVEKLKPV